MCIEAGDHLPESQQEVSAQEVLPVDVALQALSSCAGVQVASILLPALLHRWHCSLCIANTRVRYLSLELHDMPCNRSRKIDYLPQILFGREAARPAQRSHLAAREILADPY